MMQDKRAIGNNPAVPKNNRSAGFPGHLEARAPIEAPIVITLYFGPLPGAALSGVMLIAPMIFPADAGV
ncbi:hypothetical protein AYJ10_03620 [Serratia marcescens]|nr:hypothetical protein AYJ10_03620 [Serratia marcescens]